MEETELTENKEKHRRVFGEVMEGLSSFSLVSSCRIFRLGVGIEARTAGIFDSSRLVV
jgi:hypothetical protein